MKKKKEFISSFVKHVESFIHLFSIFFKNQFKEDEFFNYIGKGKIELITLKGLC